MKKKKHSQNLDRQNSQNPLTLDVSICSSRCEVNCSKAGGVDQHCVSFSVIFPHFLNYATLSGQSVVFKTCLGLRLPSSDLIRTSRCSQMSSAFCSHQVSIIELKLQCVSVVLHGQTDRKGFSLRQTMVEKGLISWGEKMTVMSIKWASVSYERGMTCMQMPN